MSERNSIEVPATPSPSVAPVKACSRQPVAGSSPRVRASRGSCPCCSALAAGCSYTPRSQVCPPVTSVRCPAARRCWPRRPDWFVLWVLVPHCVAVGPVRLRLTRTLLSCWMSPVGGFVVEVWKSDSH